jgi:flagellar hook-associated protein 2
MVTSIGYALGAGAGIDTKAIIESLAAAAKAPKEALIAKREAANSAKVSALAQMSNSIDGFTNALSTLIAGGTLYTQPSVSDSSVLTATAVPGVDIGILSSQVEVRQLAQAQTLVSTNLANASSSVGQGRLTLTVGARTAAVEITAANDSLDGLAKAINASNIGVAATVVVDTNGARLMLKGPTGEANAFRVSLDSSTTPGLERFAYAPDTAGGMTVAQEAKDAIVRVDGVEVRRSSNGFDDLIPGIRFELKKAVVGSTVSIGMTRPAEAITQAVNDFVVAYNQLHKMLADATAPMVDGAGGGPLRGDVGVREMQRQLAKLTTTVISTSGGPATLAEIGIATNREGTLRVESDKLKAALENDPKGVEALFNPRQHSSDPRIAIVSAAGSVKPGTYTLTDLVAATGGTGASGKFDGVVVTSSGSTLAAPGISAAKGLLVRVDGNVASATITIDAGLGGALQSIRDSLRAATGPFATTQARLSTEGKRIAEDRQTLERRSQAYYDQLVKNFSAMDRRVSAFKATQSYLDQQIKAWNRSDD